MADAQSGKENWNAEREKRRQTPSFFWPLVLIGFGITLLLSNLGYLPWQSWHILWRLWPLLLVALGIDILIGRRSMLGSIFSGVLIVLLIGGTVFIALNASSMPLFSRLTESTALHTRHVEHPLGDLESAQVDIDWSSFPGTLNVLEDSYNLIKGDLVYRGTMVFDVDEHGDHADVVLDSYVSGPWFGGFNSIGEDRRWDIGLSPNVTLDLILDLGAGSADVDLSNLQINGLLLDMGTGSVNLVLPSESSFGARIDGSAGSLSITLPESVGARVILEGGSGYFGPDERFQLVGGDLEDDSVWETDNFDTADYIIDLKIDQEAGSITIH